MVALLDLTARFAERYRREKLRMNAADFSDQEHLALGLLVGPDGIPTELGRQVADRYVEILVDEYQDTNEVQNAIFRAVSREGKNLFTVGDVKQSIYRFRLADPTIFLDKYSRYKTRGRRPPRASQGSSAATKNFRSGRRCWTGPTSSFPTSSLPRWGRWPTATTSPSTSAQNTIRRGGL
jgi:ATP-dependent helicase/nuclease subunit A